MPDSIAEGVVQLSVEINNAQLQTSVDQIAARIRASLEPATKRVGEQVSTNITAGLSKVTDGVSKAGSQAAKNLESTIGGGLKKLLSTASSTASGIASTIESGFKQAAQTAVSALGEIGSGIASVVSQAKTAIAVFAAVGAVIGGFAFVGIKAAAGFETTKVALKGLEPVLGDSAVAFDTLQKFAARTPFTFDQTKTSVIQLATALKVNLPQALGILQTIGDAGAVIGATGDQINAVTNALAQLNARGKFNAQDLLQITSAFPDITMADVIHQVAVQLGVTDQAASDLAANGLVSAKVGTQAILTVMKNVPGALGAMDRQAETFNGRLSTLHDTIQLLLASAFTPLLKVIEDQMGIALDGGTEKLTKFATEFGQHLGDAIKNAIPTIQQIGGIIADLAPVVLSAIDLFARWTQGVKIFIDLLKQGDIGGIIQGIMAGLLRMVGLSVIPDTIEKIGNAMSSALAHLPEWIRGYETAAEKTERLNKSLLEASPALAQVSAQMGVNTRTADLYAVATVALRDAIASLPASIQPLFQGGGLLGLNIGATADFISKQQQEATDALKKGITGKIDIEGLGGVSDKIQGIIDGSKAVESAVHSAGEATKRVNELLRQQTKLQHDVASEQREIAAGADAVLKANSALRDLDEQRTQLQKELADLRGPAAADAESEAQIRLERATMQLNAAKKAQLDLDKKQQKTSLDLKGLSLDEIRTRLADERAKPHAAAATPVDEHLSKELDVRQATLDLSQAQRAVDDLKAKNELDIRETLEKQADLEVSIRDAKRQQATAIEANAKLQAGETTRSQALKTINEQIADARYSQKTASEAVAEAQKKENSLLATAVDQQKEINRILFDRINIIAKTDAALAKKTLADTLPALLGSANLVNAQGKEIAGPPNITRALIDSVTSQILTSPSSDLRGVLKEILRKIGLSIPGLAKGGLVEGVAGPMGSLHRLGEFGRREAVLPLQDSARMQALLGNQKILNPILDALPRISLPQRLATSPVDHASISSALSSGKVHTGPDNRDAQMAKMIAKAMVDEMKAAGMHEKGENHFEFHVDQKPTTALSERAMKRAVEEALKRI